LKFITANGTTFATHSFQRWHPSLREFETHIMLKSSPDALSQGRLCALDGWRWVWEPYSFEPTLSKGGITVKHDVKNFVAYLPDDPEATVTVPLIGRPPGLMHPIDNGVGATSDGLEVKGEVVKSTAELKFPIPVVDVVSDEPCDSGIVARKAPRDLKAIADSREHCRWHNGKNANCEACVTAKAVAQYALRRKRDPCNVSGALGFGDLIGIDHIVLGKHGGTGISGERAALFSIDFGTKGWDIGPMQTRDYVNTSVGIQEYIGDAPVKKIFSDNSAEIKKAVRGLGLAHARSTPYRSTTNSVTDRNIRSWEEATRATLLQGGFPHT
jgi:hypothetical protein